MRKTRYAALCGLLAACLLLTGLTGCAEEEIPTFRIGVALYSQEDTFISYVAKKMEKLAKEEEKKRNVRINVSLADGGRSQSVQNEQVDRFLAQGCDILCVNIYDRTAAAVIVDKAQREGVPVIFFNREPVREDLNRWEYAYYVGSRAEQAGRIQGQLALEAWEDRQAEIDRNGDGVLQYVMLEGEPGHQDTLLRSEYSIKTLADAGVPLQRLDDYTADWQRGKAGARMEQWLREFPDGIEAVFANNDDMALGALDACVNAGMDPLPLVLGVDATDAALESILDGQLAGTVFNDAEGQAETMMELACSLLLRQPIREVVELEDSHYVFLEYSPVTAENAAEFR